MKLPYLKLYTADLLAVSRNLTAQQLGEAILGICEQAFENNTSYQPKSAHEKGFFEMLAHWEAESRESLQHKKKSGRKGGRKTQQKNKEIVGSNVCPPASSTQPKHTETDTETDTETKTEAETETENINLLTAQGPAQTLCKTDTPALPASTLREFGAQVARYFEPPLNPTQHGIWFRRNCRCLTDILCFCGQDTKLALQTIYECVKRLKKAGISGGYEAVCRGLPEYMAQARQKLAQQGEENEQSKAT